MGRERISITHPLSGPFVFAEDDVPASQTAVAMRIMELAGVTTECVGYVIPFPGSVVAISVLSTGARSADTLTVDATIDGTATGLQAALDDVNTTTHHAHQKVGLDRFAAGATIGVKITTGASWAPTNKDLVVCVWLELDDVFL